MQIIINEVPIYFEVQFSKHSKINLDVSPEGYLTLKVPTKTSEDEIMTYMKSQSKFLLNLDNIMILDLEMTMPNYGYYGKIFFK